MPIGQGVRKREARFFHLGGLVTSGKFSDFVIEADSVIIAMGHTPNSLIKRDVPQLKVNDDGTVWTDPDDSSTSIRGIFACGNVVTNATAVVEAMASGKKAAVDIENYLQKK